MKKTLLSVLAGITVIGSAAAVPSLEDRITMCKRHPDTHVWVEKTQFCARIDPCVGPTYDDMYCIEVHGVTKPEDSYARLLIERYVKNILETGVEELNYLGNNKFAIKTTDLDYKVIYFRGNGTDAGAACWAYGKKMVTDDYGVWCKNVTESECTDIGDFARLLDEEGMVIKNGIAQAGDIQYEGSYKGDIMSLEDIYRKIQRDKKGAVGEYFENNDCYLMKL